MRPMDAHGHFRSRLSSALRERVSSVWDWLRRDPGDGSDPWLNLFKRVTVVAGCLTALGAAGALIWTVGTQGFRSIERDDAERITTTTTELLPPATPSSNNTQQVQTTSASDTSTTSNTVAPSTSSEPEQPESLFIEDVRIGSKDSLNALDVAVRGGVQPSVLTAIGIHEYFLDYRQECGGNDFVELTLAATVDVAVSLEGDIAVVAPQSEIGDAATVSVTGDWSSVGGCSTRVGVILRPQSALDSRDVRFLKLSLPFDYAIETAVMVGPGAEATPISDLVDATPELRSYLPGETYTLFRDYDNIGVDSYACCAVILVVSVSDSLGNCDLHLVDLAPRKDAEPIDEHFDRVASEDLPLTCS